jgi:hypothetical protein
MISGKYIDFGAFFEKETNHWARSRWINEVREWLDEQCGKEEVDWEWVRGDLFGRGVVIKNIKDATAFRLRFGV